MSIQAGMVPYYLLKKHYGKLKFIDPVGLVSDDFTKCPLSVIWTRDNGGLSFDYPSYFLYRESFERGCNIARPEFIYDLNDPEGERYRQVANNGYTIVYYQRGSLKGKAPFVGGRVRLDQFFAVRNDIYDANPTESVTHRGIE